MTPPLATPSLFCRPPPCPGRSLLSLIAPRSSLAQQRATEHTGVYFDNDHTVLIGDTPNDVRAALAAGVQIIAVGTGKSSVNELINAGATATVTHLREVRRHISSGRPGPLIPQVEDRSSVRG